MRKQLLLAGLVALVCALALPGFHGGATAAQSASTEKPAIYTYVA